MDSYEETRNDETELRRRVLELEARLLELEAAVKTQRRMVAPVCMITAGLVLGLASFGLIPVQRFQADLLGSWTALFVVLVLVMAPFTVLTVMARSRGMQISVAAGWVLIAMIAVCMGAGPRGALAAALGFGPWYLLGAVVLTVVGLVRLPVANPAGD